MTTFQSEYETTTDTIDSIVSSQLSSVLTWTNVPGGLTKVTSSAAGFAWGYSGNKVWSCQLPCSGKWQESDLSSYSIGSVLDIASDPTTVYVLYNSIAGSTMILTTDANRQGTWATLTVPISATNIFSTHTYLWAQDKDNNKQMCPKPCRMSNWIPSSEATVTITSSTDTNLYGKDPSGTPMQTDETLRSGWSPIAEFGDRKVSSVIGGTNNLYAIDESSNPLVYNGKSVQPLSTSGYSPINITAGNNQLWMTSDKPGDKGNVFTRIEKPDHIAVANTIAPLDRKRDNIVNTIEYNFNQQTDVMTVNKQTSDVVNFFKSIFKIDGETANRGRAQWGHLNEQIRSTQEKLDQMNAVEPAIQVAILTMLVVCIIYIGLGSTLGMGSHALAVVAVGVGIYFILNSK